MSATPHAVDTVTSSQNPKADIQIETLKARFVRSAVLGVACSKGPQILNLPFVIVAANGS